MHAQQQRSFVRLTSDGRGFELGGRPWRFAGTNCYCLMTRAADPSLLHEVTGALDAAAGAGLTVVRCWAFADGAKQWNALQPAPGVFDERVFRGLDLVLTEAARRGLKLLLCLTNYWQDYGGMQCYVEWSQHHHHVRLQQLEQQHGTAGKPAASKPAAAAQAEAFYEDPDCQRMFRAFVAALVHRVNTLTGVMYRDDPTILAWSLANEPRCKGDATCCTVGRWAHCTAAFLKALDPNHLVTLDCEGFLGPCTPGDCAQNPFDCSGCGCDFWQDCGSPHIGFACCHCYPDLWLPRADEQEKTSFALRWLDCHLRLASELGKPLVLSEFGKQASGKDGSNRGGDRTAFYRTLLGASLEHMRRGAPLGGTLFWMVAADSYPDYDGFTVYLGQQQQKTAGDGTAGVIMQHAADVAALNSAAAAAAAAAAAGAVAGPHSLLGPTQQVQLQNPAFQGDLYAPGGSSGLQAPDRPAVSAVMRMNVAHCSCSCCLS